ncbi:MULTISPECIES: SH3 domain-containing protein [Roseobacteraceae]|uniref:SH3 domain-containing protein n=1 Tax=Roseobacteraceae TaxID=2854170 RepID=UPI003297E1E6
MKRFILVSFAFLALAFYELSGGTDFDAEASRNAVVLARGGVLAAPDQHTTHAALPDDAGIATRMSLNLTSLGDVLAADATPDVTENTTPEVSPVTKVTFATTPNDVVLPSLIFAGNTTRASSDAVGQNRDLRSISGDTVNMRGGPGTTFDVVAQLERNTQVEVLQDDGSGWVKLRPVDGGPDGWIAEFLLNPS